MEAWQKKTRRVQNYATAKGEKKKKKTTEEPHVVKGELMFSKCSEILILMCKIKP